MDNEQLEITKKQITELQENIDLIRLSHEKMVYEFERNIKKDNNYMESELCSKDDLEFFIEHKQRIMKLRTDEDYEYEESSKELLKRKRQMEEEIEEAEKQETPETEKKE